MEKTAKAWGDYETFHLRGHPEKGSGGRSHQPQSRGRQSLLENGAGEIRQGSPEKTTVTPEERKQRILDYQKTFLSAEGENVLADLSRVCFENRTTFYGDSDRMSAFAEGKRSVMLYIRALVAANPEETEPTRALMEDKNNG